MRAISLSVTWSRMKNLMLLVWMDFWWMCIFVCFRNGFLYIL